MIRKLSIAFAIALSLTACASANKRLEQGQELQRSGRPAEAAERYIQALKKNSRLDSARVGLRTAGAAAIEDYMRVASSASATPDQAADAFLAIDDLSRRAMEVGIFLVPPTEYEGRRRAAFDRAIAAIVADARRMAAQRQFAEALRRLERAGNAWQPSTAQANAIGNAGADVALAWGRADTTEGLFRSAYTRVDPIGNLPGVTRAQTDAARALQAAALERGTRRVAVIPTWATMAARRDLPDDALPALGDALVTEPWASPPRFVDMIPPDQVDRDLRRLGLTRRTLNTAEAARIGRFVNADFVVVTEIDSVRREDMNLRATRRPARTRSGIDTAYVLEEGTARLFAHTTYVLVDRDGQRQSEYQAVTASATAPFTRVRYAGDWRTLDLRQSERDLFVRISDDRDLIQRFVSELSPRLGQAVFAEVVRRIP
jgi:tetratricopeptide (TPR) repeat protein